MKENTISVLQVKPGESPTMVMLENTLEALQDAVSIEADERGFIEILPVNSNVCLLCNEEGKLIGLPPNRRWGLDILCGVFYVCGQNSEGELCSLHPMHADYYMQRFRIPDDIAEDEVEIFIHFLVD